MYRAVTMCKGHRAGHNGEMTCRLHSGSGGGLEKRPVDLGNKRNQEHQQIRSATGQQEWSQHGCMEFKVSDLLVPRSVTAEQAPNSSFLH